MTELQPQETVDLGQAAPVVQEPVTTQTPVPSTAEPTPKEPQQSPRDIQMRAIAEARMRKIAEEVAYADTLGDEAHDVATGVELGTTSREKLEAATSSTTPTITIDPTKPAQLRTQVDATHTDPSEQQQQPQVTATIPQRRIRTINGQQFAFTDDEWDQLAQTGAIAVARAQQQAQQLPPQPQQQQAAPTPAPQPSPPPPPRQAFDDATAQEMVRRLSYGTQEEAAGVLRNIYERARDDAVAAHQPQYQPEYVAAYATQQAIAQMRLEQNLLTIGNEYPDIFTNTRLSQLAALTLHDIRARDGLLNRQRSDLELYREACNEVRTAIGYQPPQQPTQQPQSAPQPAPQAASPAATSATRVTRKREAPQQPRSVNQSAPIDSTEKRYPTPSEVVAGYRKSRGQVSMH